MQSGLIKSESGYAYSIWILTEYGAVIDMWGDYMEADLNNVYDKMFRELMEKLLRILMEDSEVMIYVDDESLYNFYMSRVSKIDELFERIGYKPDYNIVFNLKKCNRKTLDRVYSLASYALKIKNRYPPKK